MKLIDCRWMQSTHFAMEHGFQPISAAFFVLSGSFWLRVEGKEYIIEPNTMVFFPSDMEFERRMLEPITFYHVRVEEQGELPHGVAKPQNALRMLGTLSYLCELDLRSEQGARLGAHCLADLFLQLEIEQAVKKPQADAVLRAAALYFEKNLAKKLSLDDVARHVGISPTGLIRHFKLHAATTPMRYLNSLRLRRAEELLCTTDQPLFAIAAACGFDNAFYFSNAFKKEKGISPKAFRAAFAI